MSKLSKLQEERLKKLKEVSSSGRHQRDEVLEQAEPRPETKAPPPAPTKRAPAKVEKRVGRPPLPEAVRQRTVNFTEDQLEKLEKLSARSGRKGFRSPTFNETVRVAFRLWAAHQWTDEEIRAAFDVELDGAGKG